MVTYNHFTSPHWFARRGAWLDPEAPALFARYCGMVTEALGDGAAWAVTMNEPDLPRLLTWLGLPAEARELERATLLAASEQAGVPRYRASNLVLPEEMDAMAAGMAAGHRAAREAIKSRRPELPVGLSLAIVDDQVVGDDASVRDRKRAEVYGMWLDLARDDDFIGVQNYERARYDANGEVPPPAGAPLNQLSSSDIYPLSLAGAVRYAHEATGVPVLVTEHGLGHRDDTLRAAFIEPALTGLLGVIEEGVPVLGYLHWSLMDNFEWIFGYDVKFGLHEVDRETFVRTPKASAAVYSASHRPGQTTGGGAARALAPLVLAGGRTGTGDRGRGMPWPGRPAAPQFGQCVGTVQGGPVLAPERTGGWRLRPLLALEVVVQRAFLERREVEGELAAVAVAS